MDLANRLIAELGADVVDTRPERLTAAAVDGLAPACVVTPESRQGVARAVQLCEETGAAIVPRGNGTHARVGNPPRRYDVALCTRGLARVVRHEAADMTVAVEAGATLAELEAVLAQHGQWLPLDPPRPQSVTVGGLLAADLCGGLRFSHGKARDYLIGVRAAIGGGDLVHGGGEVVKNVAGYDLPKLMIGSFGSLGIIVEATFKVRPRPAADVWLAAACASATAAGETALALLEAPLAPFAVDLCDSAAAARFGLAARPHLLVRLGGEEAEVRQQRRRLADLVGDMEEVSAQASAAARDFGVEAAVGCRLSLLPSDAVQMLEPLQREAAAFGADTRFLAHAGSGIVRLEVDSEAPVPFLHWLRFAARQRGGHLFVERCPLEAKREIDVWGDPPAPAALLRSVKQAMDARGVFSPGRFVGGL